jgi:hypothetical protein
MRAALISIPKSGTNLALAVLRAAAPEVPAVDLSYPVPYESGASKRDHGHKGFMHARRVMAEHAGDALFHGHLVFSPYLLISMCELDVKPIFLYRDPRAAIVSQVHHILDKVDHPAHQYFHDELTDPMERFAAIIRGTCPADASAPYLPEFRAGWLRFIPWIHEPESLPVRYEAIVGTAFGGDDEQQRRTFRRMLDHADCLLADEQVKSAIDCGGRPERSPTFRQGTIGGWRAEWTPEVDALFSEYAGDLLRRLHYE